MKVGILTGGGDCPGLNAVIRAVVRKGERVHGDELVGFLDGWRGVIEGRTMPLDVERMRGTLPRGGTVLGTSRTNPYKVEGGVEACLANLERLGHRGPGGHRGRGHPRRGQQADGRGRATSSACRRRSTTTCRPPR